MINESFIAGFIAGVVATVLTSFVFGLGFAVIRPWIHNPVNFSERICSLVHFMKRRPQIHGICVHTTSKGEVPT